MYIVGFMGRLKKRVMVNLPPELVEKARRYGLNFSKILENALREYIRRLEVETGGKKENCIFLGSKKCGGWDSNPRRATPQGPKPCALDQTWLPPRG